ncbi:universal stress protein [Halomicrococcus sp. SG-WS-1]|uniref:universal stress protein n=1 Tax=Halomicrococcus sp. SG-WS-1 TaxID=3439057 RepID=UPI003F7A2825
MVVYSQLGPSTICLSDINLPADERTRALNPPHSWDLPNLDQQILVAIEFTLTRASTSCTSWMSEPKCLRPVSGTSPMNSRRLSRRWPPTPSIRRQRGPKTQGLCTNDTRGVPYEAIVEYSTEHETGLIVMGLSGRSGITECLLESTTDRVTRSVDTSVFIARS